MPFIGVNLTTTGFLSREVIVGQATRIAFSVDHDDDTYTWDTGAMSLQWTVDEDLAVWQDYEPGIVLTVGTRGYARVPVAGVIAVRWRCSIADASADPSARMDYVLS